MIGYLLFTLCLMLQATGQILLKAGTNEAGGWLDTLFRWQTAAGIGILGLNMLIWLGVLRYFNLSYIYPLGAVLYVIVALGSVVWLKEQVTWEQWLGIGFIVLGVTLLTTWSGKPV